MVYFMGLKLRNLQSNCFKIIRKADAVEIYGDFILLISRDSIVTSGLNPNNE